ncbi:MAG: RlmE family RNA methyltransferase [Desulfamplus sp.]|nr:RlmE family RNA methyltransferase [Desulfamplus sp.]
MRSYDSRGITEKGSRVAKKEGVRTEKFKKGKQQWADHLTEKAKHDNYPARSVYKLMEIQKKYGIMRKGNNVLDLGCAPGSWLIYAAQTIALTQTIGQDTTENLSSRGVAVGIDLQKVTVTLPPNATALQGDIFDLNKESCAPDGETLHTTDSLASNARKEYDVVLSDMAPATTGRKDIDAARSFELCQAALKIACELLASGGNFVCKIFQGPDFKQFEQNVKTNFRKHTIFKPESCRKASKEIYIIGIGKI